MNKLVQKGLRYLSFLFLGPTHTSFFSMVAVKTNSITNFGPRPKKSNKRETKLRPMCFGWIIYKTSKQALTIQGFQTTKSCVYMVDKLSRYPLGPTNVEYSLYWSLYSH